MRRITGRRSPGRRYTCSGGVSSTCETVPSARPTGASANAAVARSSGRSASADPSTAWMPASTGPSTANRALKSRSSSGWAMRAQTSLPNRWVTWPVRPARPRSYTSRSSSSALRKKVRVAAMHHSRSRSPAVL
jgi:hypothetical protein